MCLVTLFWSVLFGVPVPTQDGKGGPPILRQELNWTPLFANKREDAQKLVASSPNRCFLLGSDFVQHHVGLAIGASSPIRCFLLGSDSV